MTYELTVGLYRTGGGGYLALVRAEPLIVNSPYAGDNPMQVKRDETVVKTVTYTLTLTQAERNVVARALESHSNATNNPAEYQQTIELAADLKKVQGA